MTVVNIARCPEHGLHGERAECFVCGGPVDQVPMVHAGGVLQPKGGWMQVGCPDCGLVHMWPVERWLEEGGRGPWCTHGGSAALFFGRGEPSDQWTQVVPVLVMEAEATPVEPCSTCGGTREVYAGSGAAGDAEVPCPDCPDCPEPEPDRMERAAVAAAREAMVELHENIERMRAARERLAKGVWP